MDLNKNRTTQTGRPSIGAVSHGGWSDAGAQNQEN